MGEEIITRDRHGSPVYVGDFVCFVEHDRDWRANIPLLVVKGCVLGKHICGLVDVTGEVFGSSSVLGKRDAWVDCRGETIPAYTFNQREKNWDDLARCLGPNNELSAIPGDYVYDGVGVIEV